jgi:hypothetical protein
MADFAELISVMKRTVDAERLVARAVRVRESDRWCSLSRFNETLQHLADEARKMGMVRIETVRGVPGRGRGSGAWTQWERWDVRGAKLAMADGGEVIADYKENPLHIAFLSAPTPEEGVKAEVVVCDDPAMIETGQLKVRNRLILSRGNLSKLRALAPEAGAAGLIIDGGPRGSEDDLGWLQLGWGCWPPGQRTFAFSISRKAGEKLRARIAEGRPVELTAKVDTHFEPGGYPWLTAILPGTSAHVGEVLAQAHAFEPGVIDNASGVSCLWEAAVAIQSAIWAGLLPRPPRAYRVLTNFECFGFYDFAYQRPELVPNLAADVNVDGIGLKEVDSSINRQPLFQPNYLDEFVDPFREAAQRVAGVNWPARDYQHGNDKILSDPHPQFAVPTLDFTCDGSTYDGLHNSRDDGRHLDAEKYPAQVACVAAMIYHLMTVPPAAIWKGEALPLATEPREGPGAELIPARTWPGIPMLENLPTWAHAERIMATRVHRHALLWANGRRTVGEIAARLEAEGRGADLSVLLTYYRELESVGYCRLRKP